MKRSEVTMENLKALGYVAYRQNANAWTFSKQTSQLNQKQSDELFRLVVDATRQNKAVDIHYNLVQLEVRITLPELDAIHGDSCRYYLSRPMTKAEQEREEKRIGMVRTEDNGKIVLSGTKPE